MRKSRRRPAVDFASRLGLCQPFRAFEREGLQTSGRSVIRLHSIRYPFDMGALAVEVLLTHLAVKREECASTHNLPLWTFGPAEAEAASG